MAKIRSAWEIALEKTQDIQIDKDRLAREENFNSARRLAGSYLNYDEDMDEERLREQYSLIAGLDGARDGIRQSVLQNLTLPTEQVLSDRYERIQTLCSMISHDAQVAQLMTQIVGFLKQYPEHQRQLVDQLKERFEPMMQEKAAKLRQQYGQDVPMSVDRDPEFLKIAQQQLDALRQQYEQMLQDAKGRLEAML